MPSASNRTDAPPPKAAVRRRMSRRRKVTLWLGLCLSLPAAAYASLGFVYFVWLEGMKQWPTGQANLMALGALAFAVTCGGVFIYCLVSLIREAAEAHREKQRAKRGDATIDA